MPSVRLSEYAGGVQPQQPVLDHVELKALSPDRVGDPAKQPAMTQQAAMPWPLAELVENAGVVEVQPERDAGTVALDQTRVDRLELDLELSRPLEVALARRFEQGAGRILRGGHNHSPLEPKPRSPRSLTASSRASTG